MGLFGIPSQATGTVGASLALEDITSDSVYFEITGSHPALEGFYDVWDILNGRFRWANDNADPDGAAWTALRWNDSTSRWELGTYTTFTTWTPLYFHASSDDIPPATGWVALSGITQPAPTLAWYSQTAAKEITALHAEDARLQKTINDLGSVSIGAEPAFTTLSINKGGTGATTAQEALTALGAAASSAVPTASTAAGAALGLAAAGTSSNYARADHVHPLPTAADIGAEPTITTLPISKGGTGATTAASALGALSGLPCLSAGGNHAVRVQQAPANSIFALYGGGETVVATQGIAWIGGHTFVNVGTATIDLIHSGAVTIVRCVLKVGQSAFVSYTGGTGFTFTRTAISHADIVWGGTSSIPAAQTNSDGLMSQTDKQKLNSIAAGAQVNVKPDWSAVSGASAEILNKPTIPAAQVQTDWNATTGLASIANKPTIPAAQVQTDWNATTGLASIANKPSKWTIPIIANMPYILNGTAEADVAYVCIPVSLLTESGVGLPISLSMSITQEYGGSTNYKFFIAPNNGNNTGNYPSSGYLTATLTPLPGVGGVNVELISTAGISFTTTGSHINIGVKAQRGSGQTKILSMLLHIAKG
jgi:hypothetical protein